MVFMVHKNESHRPCFVIFSLNMLNKMLKLTKLGIFAGPPRSSLSMVREVVFGVGFALLLPYFFGLDGVLYSMPLSDILTFLIAAYLIVKTYRSLEESGT